MRIIIATALAAALCACQPKADVAPESAAAAKPAVDVKAVAAKLVGKWQNIEDEKSAMTFDGGGDPDGGAVMIDYSGDNPINDMGGWKVFTSADAPAKAKEYTLEAGKAYLEVSDMDGAFYYELGEIDADTFEMFYLGRGNRQAWKRVN